MGFFSKESKDLCYFCNNDYFELFKTLDSNYVCKDCMETTSIETSEIMFLTLDQIIKEKETCSLSKTKATTRDTYCTVCNKHIASGSTDYVSLNSNDYCQSCGNQKIKTINNSVPITASNHIPGYEIESHLDFLCVEALIGLGYNMNYEGQTLFGRQSGDKDMKFKEAKSAALLKLKIEASSLGGHGVIDVSLSSTVFYDKRSVVATGTVVKLKKTN